jgi:hypothetical protein
VILELWHEKPKGITLLYLIPIVLFHGISFEVDNFKRKLCGLFRRSWSRPDSFSDIQRRSTLLWLLSDWRNKRWFWEIGKFQPRSFNMGLSRKAFDASKGFGNISWRRSDLSIRLWNLGFETKLFKCVCYHKRRIDWDKFSTSQ